MGQNLAEDFDVLMLGGGGDTTCAISTDNRLKCWGANAFGRLGLGDMKDRGDHAGEMGQNLADMNLGDDFEIAKVRCSVGHCCAMSTDGELKCWGNNKHGELGYEHRSNVGTRSALDGDLDVIDLGSRPDFIVADFTVNDGSTCAISTKGYSKCWGRGDEGQLEFGDYEDVGGSKGDMGNALPYNSAGRDAGLVRSKRRIASNGGSASHFCMYEAGSAAKGTCWGKNDFGQLGCGGKTMNKQNKKGKKQNALWKNMGKKNKNGNKKNGQDQSQDQNGKGTEDANGAKSSKEGQDQNDQTGSKGTEETQGKGTEDDTANNGKGTGGGRRRMQKGSTGGNSKGSTQETSGGDAANAKEAPPASTMPPPDTTVAHGGNQGADTTMPPPPDTTAPESKGGNKGSDTTMPPPPDTTMPPPPDTTAPNSKGGSKGA